MNRRRGGTGEGRKVPVSPRAQSTYPRCLPVGDSAISIEFGNIIDEALNRKVYAFASEVEQAAIPGVTELVPSYRSLLVQYDLMLTRYDSVAPRLMEMAAHAVVRPEGVTAHPIIEIPVAYGGEFGPDLEALAKHAGLPQEEVIRIHSHNPYRVYMLGFSPGFPYLGGIDARIACPRHNTPRTKVAAGSVGIAESQTGIYPNDSPGGWQIIGRTPVRLFDPTARPPAVAQPGEFIQFVPVDLASFRDIAAEVAAGRYKPRTKEGPR